MKKRSLGIVLALVMALVLGTSAMAASSIQASGIITDADAWDAEDTGWDLLITELHEEDEWLLDDISDPETLEEVLGDDYHDGLEVVDAVDISIIGDISKVVWDVTAELEIAGVTEDSEVYMLHWTGDEWEIVPIEVGDGYITATMSEFSPFAFVANEDFAESPKTGHPMATTAVIMVIAAAATLVVVSRRFAR